MNEENKEISGISTHRLADLCVRLYTIGVASGQPTYSTIYKKEIVDDIMSELEDILTAEGCEKVKAILDKLPSEFSCY